MKRLTESSLSRVWRHIQEHECAIITAFRGSMDNCVECDPDVDPRCSQYADSSVPLAANKEANRRLKAVLLKMGYGVTAVDGAYIENFNTEAAREVREDSFFVVNLSEDSEFFSTIEDLGLAFCQDAVILIPKGGSGAYLLGTNHASFPSLGMQIPVGNFTAGDEAEFMTKVGGRPFVFETYEDLPRLQRMACSKLAESFKKVRKPSLTCKVFGP